MIHHSIHIVLYSFDLEMTLTKIYDLKNLNELRLLIITFINTYYAKI